jgi:cell division protein FtsI (penicillin-binding protein 3)
VGIDGEGLSGLERVHEKKLATAPVLAKVARDAHGTLIQLPTADEESIEPQSGHSIQLTIDIELQRILDDELEQGRVASGSKGAFGVMVDAGTGEILAMSQAPSPDFNTIRKYDPIQLRNFTAEATFEPGSILKAVVAAGALERGVVRPREMINCERGNFRYAGRTVHDAHPSDVISFHDVVVRSSNIGMAKVGDRLGRNNLYRILQTFGFGRSSGIGVPGESGGILRPVSSWAQIDVATHSYGQGIAVTPLQVVRAMSSLANGGTLNPLQLVSGRPITDEPKRVISERSAQLIEEMLVGVVEDEHGTGSFAAIPGIRVGGKTGTAQKARIGGKGYLPGKYMSSFVGFVDANTIGVQNRLVLLVTMDEPSRGSYYGGIVAAPVFQKTMKRTLEHLSLRTVLGSSTITAQRDMSNRFQRVG